MAITSSAKKAQRASLRKRVFNVRRAKAMGDAIREVKHLVATKKTKEALALMPKVYAAIDKAAKGNTIKKGKASRAKARLMAVVNKGLNNK